MDGLWAFTLYLHDNEPNVLSTAAAAASMATALCDSLDRPHVVRRHVWTAGVTYTFVVENAFPYVHNHAAAVYGLWALPPTLVATAVIVELAMHLRLRL